MKNISDLRESALKTIKDLQRGTIDIDEAGVSAKLYETVISSCKAEMEYHKFLNQTANIKFLEGADIIKNIKDINASPENKLLPDKNKK